MRHWTSRAGGRNGLSSISTLAVIALGLMSLTSAGGCYERVVKAKGLGADSVTVQESYQENSKLDNWLFGEPSTSTKKATPLDR